MIVLGPKQYVLIEDTIGVINNPHHLPDSQSFHVETGKNSIFFTVKIGEPCPFETMVHRNCDFNTIRPVIVDLFKKRLDHISVVMVPMAPMAPEYIKEISIFIDCLRYIRLKGNNVSGEIDGRDLEWLKVLIMAIEYLDGHEFDLGLF